MSIPFYKKLNQYRREKILLVVLILSILLIGSSVYWFAVHNKWLDDDYAKQNEIARENEAFDDLFLNIQIAESAVRGYAGTGNPKFVENFKSVVDSIRLKYRYLKSVKTTATPGLNHDLISEFEKVIGEKVEFMKQVKKLCDLGNLNNAQALLATERGIVLTDSILKLNAMMNITVRDTLSHSEKVFTKINRKNNRIGYSGIAVSVFLLLLVFYFLIKEIHRTRKISEQLELQKEYLRVTLYSIGEGLITTGKDGKIIYMNPAAERLTGWTNDEAKTRPLHNIYNVVNEETGKPIEHVVARILKEKRVVELENNTLLQTKHAGQLVISNNGSPIWDRKGDILGTVLVFNDITDKKRAEERMKRAVERYDILAKATSDCIWDWDLQSDTILYNEGIRKIFGYNFSEIKDGSVWWRANIHPEESRYVTDSLDQVFKNRDTTAQIEYRYRCADNTYKYILDRSFVVYDQHGTPVRMIGAMQDMTQEKEQERRIAKAIIDTQERERAQIGMELHDNVNQLLSVSLMYIKMALKSSQQNNDLKESLNNCIGYINNAVEDIRKLSHQLTPSSLNDISLKEVIEILVKTINKSGQFAISVDVDEFDEDIVKEDIQTNLYRILQEQFNNIIKYSRATRVDVSLKLQADSIKMQIADNGVGFSVDSAKEGIGLKNIKRRTEIFAGKFNLISSPGNGCELTVEFPV